MKSNEKSSDTSQNGREDSAFQFSRAQQTGALILLALLLALVVYRLVS